MKRVFVFLFLLLFFPSLAIAQSRGVLWRGVDLSYVNELEGCGAAWYKGGRKMSPYKILNEAGANVVRLRLWHSPEWTEYSTLRDVKRSIRRARENNMRVLLDFHYSDDWAHPGKQIIPAAWKHLKAPKKIAEALRKYTYDTLMELHGEGLLPEYVQIGNETNTEMMMEEGYSDTHPIRWERNVHFLNAGILAVKQVMQKTKKHIGIMLHIAQPEYVEGFFDDALKAGLYDFDIIGLSYYPKWSEVPISLIEYAVKRLRYKYKKEVVIVETAYPWTLANGDTMGNLLGEEALEEGYPASQEGQRAFMIRLMGDVVKAGGLGIVYWEPAWISSSCKTRWGAGSAWENATLFDFKGRLMGGADYLNHHYQR